MPEWAFAQQRCYKQVETEQTGRRWATALTKKLWEVAWDQWKHHDGILHDGESVLVMADTDAEIWELHQESLQDLPRCDGAQFRQSLDALLKQRPAVRRVWVANVRAAFSRAR